LTREYLSGIQYIDYLEKTLPVLLENTLLNVHEGMWFQHDSACPHTYHQGHNRLTNNFPDTDHPWGANHLRSADLNLLDFFLWGCIKENVYAIEVQGCDDMISHILAAATDIRNQFRKLVHARTPFDIAAKHACQLEVVTLDSSCEEISRIVSPHCMITHSY
jgi:hypothetical protein